MRNLNYCHIYHNFPKPAHSSQCLSVSVWSSENWGWTLASSDPLMLFLFLFCMCMEPLSNQSHGSRRFPKSLKELHCVSSRSVDGGRDEVGFGLRCLWEWGSCQRLWDVPLSKTHVCVYTDWACVYMWMYIWGSYGASDVSDSGSG